MKLSSKRFPFVLTLFAMLLAILTAGAGAQTVTQTQTVSVPSTALSGPYQTNLPITKFDPTLGSLQSVTITLQGDITSSMKIEVIDTIGHSVGATASGTLMLERPDLSNIVTLTPTSTVGPLALQPFVQFQNGAFVGDLVVDYGGTSGHDFGQITATGSLNALLSLPGDLALFTGSGSIQLPFSAQASSSFSGITGLAPWNGKPWLGAPNSPGGINLKSVAQVITSSTDAKVTVVYTYIPPSVTISGAVDIDWNEDNIVDGNDTGKAGVTLQLFDSQGNPVLDSHGNPVTTTTDANGNYSFSNLLPGTYTVKETVPSGFRTAGASTTSQTVNATNSVTNANFYIVCIKSSVYGTVYFDINGNGKQDSNEPGIPGVTVILTDEDGGPCMCLDGTPVPPAVTNADGSYSFLNVCIGDGHHVTVIPPAGMTQTADPDGVLDNTTTINITPTPVLGVDFGYTGTGSISGTIFNDVNGNGVRNLPGDNGIPAGTVTLIWAGPDGVFGDGDDVVFPSVQTDSSGHYAFANLPPGNFKVVVDPTTLPSNTFPTYDLDGISTPNSAQVTLSVMGTSIPPINNVDFGYTTASTLSGYVYIDANNNGMFDGNETPIKGVSVTLTGTTNLGSPIGPITVTTDSTGAYGFGNLLPGTYTLQETQPAGYLDGKDTQGTPGTGTTGNDQFTNITLSSGVSGINNNFGELQPASLSGFVYVDANDDGMKQSTEAGIAGVTVTLKGTDDLGNAVNASTTTASDGSYSFANLRPGTYSITETPPAGYLDGKDSVGSQGTGSVGVDQISSITLNSGINGTDNDFGNLLPASLSGYVYVDANNDGIKQSTEAGIANVKITLTGSDDLGHSVNVSTTTASDGSYSFANLRPGTYSITETQPAGYADGKDTIGTPGGTTGNDQFTNIVLNSGVNGTNNNFGERVPPASLSGYVYVDTNNDGVKQSTEAGIANVKITLTGTDNQGNAVNLTTTTASDGSYSFANLAPGTYTITETQPAGYADGKDTIGTLGGTTTNDQFSSIVANSGAVGTGYNFGELAATGATRTFGFWKTHLPVMKLALSDINLGTLTCTPAQGGGTQDLTSPSIAEVESIFWTSPGKSTTSVGQSRLQLAHQLIAAMANVYYLGTTTASAGYSATLISDAVAALDGTDTAKMDSLASTLDSFNTSGDNIDFPNGLSEGANDSKGSQALAGNPGKGFN